MYSYDIRDLTPGEDVVVRWKIKNNESLEYYDAVIPWKTVDDIVCHHWSPEDEDVLEDDDLFYEELAMALAPESATPMTQEQLDAINDELKGLIDFYVERGFRKSVKWETLGYGG